MTKLRRFLNIDRPPLIAAVQNPSGWYIGRNAIEKRTYILFEAALAGFRYTRRVKQNSRAVPGELNNRARVLTTAMRNNQSNIRKTLKYIIQASQSSRFLNQLAVVTTNMQNDR